MSSGSWGNLIGSSGAGSAGSATALTGTAAPAAGAGGGGGGLGPPLPPEELVKVVIDELDTLVSWAVAAVTENAGPGRGRYLRCSRHKGGRFVRLCHRSSHELYLQVGRLRVLKRQDRQRPGGHLRSLRLIGRLSPFPCTGCVAARRVRGGASLRTRWGGGRSQPIGGPGAAGAAPAASLGGGGVVRVWYEQRDGSAVHLRACQHRASCPRQRSPGATTTIVRCGHMRWREAGQPHKGCTRVGHNRITAA